MVGVEFFFDCSSPWTYLAFEGMDAMSRDIGFEVSWTPILVGGVFNAVNPTVYQFRDNPPPAKLAYQVKDLADWAGHCGLDIVWPPKAFPVNSVKAMRGCIVAAREGRLVPFARAAFEAYWRDDRDISQDDVLRDVSAGAGLDPQALMTAIAAQDVKDALRANTDDLIARGGFGSPTVFVNGDDMYFGNDRLPLVRRAIERAADSDTGTGPPGSRNRTPRT